MLQVFCLLIFAFCIAFSTSKISEVRQFPNNLMFGAATAAYQVEGAWNEDGKSVSIWDTLSHEKHCRIKKCHTGDVADDSYHNVKRDVEMIRELGLDYYRFSISWTRILPNGFPDKLNEAGVQHYNYLINELLKYNIEPIVTIYHWDLPQKLQDFGGWTNPHIVEWFGDYARTCFELFGDRVKMWITINEPQQVCYKSYGAGIYAPQYAYGGYADYLCAKNLLVAHAKAYHIYDEEFRCTQEGIVGITVDCEWYEPASDSDDDIAAAEDARQFYCGLYLNPIFSENGNYPDIMIEKIATKSAEQGYWQSRLPEFTPEEVDYVLGTYDYLGLNHYTTNLAYRNASVYSREHQVPSMIDDMDVATYQPSEWPGSASEWLKVVPWGFYEVLTYIRENYNNPPVFITENGFSTKRRLEDDDRISYIRQYLDAMLDAIGEGSDIRGYTVWSLMDNFEWQNGYTERFGLYDVDYEDPTRTRTPRKSAFVYKEILRTRTLDPLYEPPTHRVMTIDDGH